MRHHITDYSDYIPIQPTDINQDGVEPYIGPAIFCVNSIDAAISIGRLCSQK